MPSSVSHYLVGDVGTGATVLQGKHLSVGFTAEQVRALIEAATKGADERLAEVSRQLGVTQGAMRTMLATLGKSARHVVPIRSKNAILLAPVPRRMSA
jgi:hypothetical protein